MEKDIFQKIDTHFQQYRSEAWQGAAVVFSHGDSATVWHNARMRRYAT
jgi:hypothetical protein